MQRLPVFSGSLFTSRLPFMILYITHSQDTYTVDIFKEYLERRNIPCFRLDTDHLATGYRFTYSDEKNKHRNMTLTSASGAVLDLSEVKAVWYRKIWHLDAPEELDEDFLAIYRQEYNTVWQLLVDELKDRPWINDFHQAQYVIDRKMYQLQKARAAGLVVPDTLFTSDEQAVRDFYHRHNGQVIMKLHGGLQRNMHGRGAFFPATFLQETDLAGLQSLIYCPMIFQQTINKAYELRVVYVAGLFFTGRIDTAVVASQYEDGSVTTDWRTHTGASQWQSYELPNGLKEKLHTLMHSLQLSFGAIDIIREPDGEYVFLEVNPQGEWGMLQRDLHYPIAETIADTLIREGVRCKD
jgi:glutathione synthase/RimK-type ligase-like ATP-grasp enzyme